MASGAAAPPASPQPAPATIADYLQFIFASGYGAAPQWPPDVFGVTAALLHRSGAYAYVLQDWPPAGVTDWPGTARRIAQQWRNNIATSGSTRPMAVPPEVTQDWGALINSSGSTINQISSNGALCHTLIRLCAIADETCWGFGIPASQRVATGAETVGPA